MALILKDRVKESSSSSGTGSITLGGAFPGYQTFNAAIATGSTVYYTIHNLTAGSDTEWEVGVGTFTSPSTLARNTVLSSSNSGSLVPFTSGVSGLEVFVTQPAEQALYTNQATGIVESSGNGANTIAFTNINASNIVTVSGTISTNAANATDITNKQYVDGLFSTGITYHAPVLVETPTALTATYNQPGGAGNGVGATLTNSGANVALSIDGVSLSNTARVLVYQQSNAVQNGVYTVTNPGAPDSPGPGAAWVLTRATDADTYGVGDPNKLGQGDAFFVTSGNTGAGETYILNTVGTITFGTTNLTFAQISSAQIYAAGTGLNLSNLTFSIANTAVTAAQYGNDGNVAQITVNAQGQLTNAANVAINASSITVGTLANARTTADSANGASTIVSRDSNGGFTANTIAATTVNATSGNFTNITGNAIALTAINASNITSGTIDNARTTGNTANSASTIVLRDATGNFGANTISGAFSGDGSAINAINASNISSGTIANARTTAASANGAATIVLRDSSGSFAGNVGTFNGVTVGATNSSFDTDVLFVDATNNRVGIGTSSPASKLDISGTFNATSFGVIGARTQIKGTNADITGATGSGTEIFGGSTPGILAYNRDGSAYLPITINALTVALQAEGTTRGLFSSTGLAVTGTIAGNGAPLTAINASNVTSGTLDNARTTAASANGASTIVARDANGSFTANVGTFTTVSGAGGGLTSINASNISSGTVATARLATGTANSSTYLRGDQTWATVTSGITLTDDTSTNATRYPLLTASTSGTISTANVSSTKLTFNPSTGNLVATIHHSSSDARLKTDIKNIPDALVKISQINGVTYLRTDTPETVRHTGVIAQEVEAVLPEVVAIGLDGYKVVAYGNMIGLLVEAIKELKAEVDALKGK